MKKITLLILGLLFSISGYSQLSLESFEGSTGPDALPSTNWTLSSGSAGNQWAVFENFIGSPTPTNSVRWSLNGTYPANTGTSAALMQRQSIGAGNVAEDYLATPMITVPTNGRLRFFTRSTISGDQGTVYQIKVNTNTTAGSQTTVANYTTQVIQYTETTLSAVYNAYEEKIVDLSAFAGQNVYIAFVMRNAQAGAGIGGDRWLVDDVKVVQQCLDPTNLTANAITQTGATLGWTNPSGATSWEVEIVTTLQSPTGVGTVTTTNPYVATGLTPSTCYNYYVRALCTSGPSLWVGPFNFCTATPGFTCSGAIPVTTLPYSTTNDTATFADNYDTPQPSACAGGTTNYMAGNDVFYAFTPTTTGTVSVTMTPNATDSGIFIYSSCANVGVACLAGVANTGSGVRSIPNLNVTAGQTYIIVLSSSANTQTYGYNLVIQTVNCGQPTNLSAVPAPTSAQLSWNAGAATSCQYVVQNAGAGIPTTAGTTTTTFSNVTVNNTYSGVPLTVSTNYEYWVRSDCNNGTFSAWTGPFPFSTTATCPQPTALTIAPQSTTATLAWTNTSSATSFEVLALLCTDPAPTATSVGTITSSNPYQFTGLNPDTCYNFYVRAICSPTDKSLWSTITGNTQIAPPICGGTFTDPGGATANYANSTDSTVTICPTTPGDKVTVTFTSFSTETNWDALYVFDGNSIASTQIASTNPAGNVPGGLAGGYWGTTIPGPFTSTSADGCLTFRFRSDGSVNNPGWIANVTCAPPPTCQQPILLTISNITAFTAVAGWTSPGTATTWQILVQPAGSAVPTASSTGWVVATTNPYTITGLTQNTNYEYYVRGDCGAVDGVSLWSGPKPFTTTPTCPKPTALTTSLVTSTAATLSWTNNSSATNFEVIALQCTDPAPTNTSAWIATTLNPYNFTGLNPDTCYNFYVRAICSPTDTSDVSIPATANTQLVPPACGGTFTDPGGANANYANTTDSTTTICPTIPGQQVTVTFTQFNTETNWDGLYVFDGNSIASPQIASNNPAGNVPGGLTGSYWGTTIPGPFTSSSADGCLTFRFRSDGSVNYAGWVANVTCLPPPTCIKPNLLTTANLTLTGATLSWTQLPNPDTTIATTWEVYIVPAGSVPPTATSTGIITSTNPYVATGLNAATCYDYYVRAVCSATDNSLWAGPKSFCTLIPNDECDAATVVPVNSDTSCAQVVAGTVIGATASTPANICGGTADDDVWFQFTATSTSHYVALNNVAGSTTFMYTAIYSGNCNSLTQIACSNGNNSTTISGLIVGQTYLIRVYTSTATSGQNTTFNVCVGTIPPPITTNDTQYTTQQLVENVLFNSSCATVTNITTSTGTNFGSVNGIGYFNKNGSTFPFNDGVILTSGSITNAPGPNTSTSSDGTQAWTGDTDLEAIILAATGNPMNSRNASKLEFDFVPLVDNISFDFIFASEEYGTFQCTFSDAFAFILTDLTAGGTPTNLAVIPNTTPPTPISVVTVRDNTFNTGCASLNAQYFGDYHLLPLGLDPLGAPTNFNGDTVPLTAQSAVIPGHQYHIKLVVADRSDNVLDSAVFLKGGSFNFGLELGLDFLITNGTALCYGNENILTSGLNPAQYTFVWSENGVVIPGQTGPNLTINHSGTYSLVAQLNGTTCTATDSKTVEYYLPINIATPSNLSICNASGYGQFNLSSHNPIVTTGLQQPATYTVSYYLTEADAIAGTNQLPNLYTNTTQFLQTIYVRAQNGNGCFGTAPVQLVVQDLTPTFTMTPNFSICAGSTGTISVTATNYDPAQATYSWTLNGNPFAATTSSISVTQAGTYVVTVNNFGCTANGSTQVTVNPYPIIAQPANQTNCNSYTLPALTVGNYFTGTGGTGTPLSAGDVITTSQIIYIYAVNGNGCSSEKSFTVSIVPIASPTVSILTQPTCAVQTGSIEVTSPIGTTSSLATDLFISEVTDAETGSLTYVELYNGTGVTKDLSNYKLKIYNNGSTTASCDLILSGTILNGTTNVIKVSSDANQVSVTPNQSFPGCGGVNTNDNIRLTTSANVPIDNWGRTDGVDFTPMNMPGYTYRRLQAAPHPSLVWNPTDWTVLDPEDYSDVGSYSLPSPSTYSYSLDGGTYTTNPIFTGLIPGSHTVTVQNVGTGCVSLPTTVTINAVPFTTAVTTFSYATPVCKIATSNPTPNTTEPGFTFGGIYSTLNTGISLNPTTGEINLANTLAGTYTITYTASNLSLCQNVSSSDATIVITAPTTPVTAINYATPVCKIATTNPGPNPSPPGFIPNGTYSSTAGLSINSSTGVINLATSTAGQYLITYSVGSNPSICQDSGSSTFPIQIDAPTPSVTTFTYASPFCKTSTNNPGPNLSPPGFVTGGTYSSTAGLSINSLTGFIDLATSTVGQYVITYSVNDNPSTCQSANSSTFTVQIIAPATPVTSFSYATPFCSISPNASPVLATGFATGGTFTATNGLIINPNTGVVDINASNPGSYSVTYTVNANATACQTSGNSSTPLVIKNDIEGQVAQGCQGPNYILTVSPLNNSYDPASATYSWSDGSGSLGSQESQTVTNPGNYTVTITSAGCTGTVVVLVDAFGCSIPKGISPNGDQKNDFFDLTGLNVKQLGIFNRYGIKVYSKTDYTKEWFGQSNADEELPDGTYYYVIERENQETRTGWVYINRENK